MLKSLYISNYAIIDELELSLAPGLTTITGETGAGKSIMTGALNLILGERADTSVLYSETKNCVVEGVYNISEYNLKKLFEDLDLIYSDELIIRRVIYPTGKSRAFLNDEPITLRNLKTIMSQLIQQHGQFDTLDINSTSFQMNIIDALAQNRTLVSEYSSLYKDVISLEKEIEHLKEEERKTKNEQEFLNFQLNEIKQLQLQPDEQEEIEQELETLEHSEEIKSVFASIYNNLEEGDNNIIDIIRSTLNNLDEIRQSYPQSQEYAQRLKSVLIELQDISHEASLVSEEVEFNPELIAQQRSRLDSIYKLLKKYNLDDSNGIIAYREELGQKIKSISLMGDTIDELQAKYEAKYRNLESIGRELHQKRLDIAPLFSEKVENILHDIAMEHARLKVDLSLSEKPLPNGFSNIVFTFAANIGSKLDNIKEVASGGELSRLALAIKSVVASAMTLPTMLFDEIDQGVSGDISLKMGNLLKKLAKNHQIIVITHSAQVASQGDEHLYVYKENDDNRTYTKLKDLKGNNRVKHIAVMLSHDPPSEAAMKNAEELITQLN